MRPLSGIFGQIGQTLRALRASPQIKAMAARLEDNAAHSRERLEQAKSSAKEHGEQFYRHHVSPRPQLDRFAKSLFRNLTHAKRGLIPWNATLEIIDDTLERSPEPLGVMECHPDGSAELILFNAVNRRLSGLDKKQVRGTNVSRFFEAEDIPRVRDFIQRCMKDGRATEKGMRMKRRAGGYLMVDMNAWIIREPNIAAFQVIDETVRETAKGWNHILEEVTRHSSGAKAIVRFDKEGSPVIMLTSSALTNRLNHKANALNGLPFQQLLPRHLHSALDTRLRRLDETGQFNWQAVTLLSRDGQEVLCDIEANASDVEGGRYAEVFFGDAQARIHAEQDAAAARDKDTIAATAGQIGHDLNNSLSVFFASLEVFQMENKNNDDPMIPAMRKRLEMTAKLVRRLRNLGDSNRPTISCDLHEILSERGITMDIKGSEGVTVKLNKVKDPWHISVSEDVAWQIYLNFVTNAIDAMADSDTKELTIETEHVHLTTQAEIRALDEHDVFETAVPGDYMVLSIEDTGPGIPPHILPRIFEDKFSTKPSPDVNRGRGLSSAQREIVKLGGLITVETKVGHGTCFKIYFPRFDMAHSTNRALSASTALYVNEHLRSPGNETVLIADDDAGVRNKMARFLQLYGYKTPILARTMDEIVDKVRIHTDLSALIMDWRMPGMTGEDLVTELVRIKPALPILVYTGLIPKKTNVHHPRLVFLEKNSGAIKLASALRELIDGDQRPTIIPKTS